MSRLYIYLLIFSPSQLRQCILLTNIAVRRDKLNETTTGEVLKYFGILIVLSKFKFIKRRDLRSNLSQHRYVPIPSMGKAWMPRDRFDQL